jgi:hypothetical protein
MGLSVKWPRCLSRSDAGVEGGGAWAVDQQVAALAAGRSASGDELHGQEGGAVGQRPQGMDRRDAGVQWSGSDLRLADEAVGVGPGSSTFRATSRSSEKSYAARTRPMPPPVG